MLETFNTSPRISMKVRATYELEGIKRKSLKGFLKYLDYEFDDGKRIYFHCGEPIERGDLSADHIIPWSYLYSDDIWNLVYCHINENSSKSNCIISEEDIVRLENRNRLLSEKFEQAGLKDKKCDELELACENDYVCKFWISARG